MGELNQFHNRSTEERHSDNTRDVPLLKDFVNRYDHPAWITLVMTFGSYGIILLVRFVLSVLVPFLMFLWF